MNKEILDVIGQAAEIPLTVHITYRKTYDDNEEMPLREIEPYSLREGAYGILLMAFQQTPKAGWRYFRFGQIASAKPGVQFEPRKRISLVTGEIETFSRPPRIPDRVKTYRDAILETLADMEVDTGEQMYLESLRQEVRIQPEEMLFVHFTVFAEALSLMLDDGKITMEEASAIKTLNTCLQKCGAGVIEQYGS